MNEQLTRDPVLAQNVEFSPKLDSGLARQVFRENLDLSIFIPGIYTPSGWNGAYSGYNQHMKSHCCNGVLPCFPSRMVRFGSIPAELLTPNLPNPHRGDRSGVPLQKIEIGSALSRDILVLPGRFALPGFRAIKNLYASTEMREGRFPVF